MTKSKTLFLVDGTAQLYRAFFALPPLTSPDGEPTGAVYGFATMLRKLFKEQHPRHLAVAWDLPGKTFRHETFSDYKANRPPTPDDLKSQLPKARQVCEVLGVPMIGTEGYEADDLIATHAALARDAGYDVVIVGSDKDLFQLVQDGVTIFDPVKDRHLDAAGVKDVFGVGPDRVLDVQALMGDSVDNIPGVPGVGGKTAVAIIDRYGDLEEVLARAERFVELFETRDRWLAAIDGASKAKDADPAGLKALAEGAAELRGTLERFVEAEADPDLGGRARTALDLLAAVDLDAVATAASGKDAVKPLREVKKALKALDRGSARKSWTSIHEARDDARLSKQLATLTSEAPVTDSPETFALEGGDRSRVEALFDELGFRALDVDFLDGEAAAAPVEAVVATTELDVVVDAGGLDALAKACKSAPRLGIHLASDGGHPMSAKLLGIAVAVEPGKASYVPLGHEGLTVPEQLTVAAVAEALGPAFADADKPKDACDLKLQAHLLERHGMELRGWGLDVMVAAFLIDSERAHASVDSLAQVYLGETVRRESGAKKRGAPEPTFDALAAEAATAAERTLRLVPVLEERLAEASLARLYETIDGPLLPVLERMESRGIRIDSELLSRMSGEMETALESLAARIHELAGGEFNIDSPTQLREVLFEQLGLKSRRKTAKGGLPSTDAQTLEELTDQHEIAAEVLSYRELSKLKGTYVDALPRLVNPETGRVHTIFHATGAATGRLSSSDPNLQNIPVRTEAGRQIRAAFVPEPGHRFLSSDYSQIELRVLAHLSGDPGLAEAFRAGEDIHRFTASQVFGVLLEMVTPTQRRRAKAVNFGILYGMSQTRLAREQGMTRPEAKRFIEAYFERFASVRQYIDTIRQLATEQAEVQTLFGRVRRFPQLRGRMHRGLQEQALRAAVNATIQGTAADLMKIAMLRVEEALAEAGLGARTLLQVHDELLLEVPEAEADTTAKLVREAMESAHALDVPLVVDQKTGPSWLDVT